MSGRGVYFAINEDTYKELLSAQNDNELISIVQEKIEERWDKEWLLETDKAWDAIHRCLTDGKLEWENGEFPLNTVVIGGKNLYKGDDYILMVIPKENTSLIAKALSNISKDILKEGYLKIQQSDYEYELGDEDFEYVWEYFKDFPNFFQKVAQSNKYIIFTVDL